MALSTITQMKMAPLWEIMIPCNWNDGQKIAKEHHRDWDSFVHTLTNGMTIMGTSKGYWTFRGEVYRERVIPVRIMCSAKQMDTIVRFTKHHYRQVAIFVAKISDDARVYEFSDG